jgi:hypothetical protein
MMTELSARLRELDTLTRPAPWSWTVGGIEALDHDGDLVEIFERESRHVTTRNENELIVTLRNNAPEIIAALEAVERVRELHVPVDECPEWGHVATPHNCPNLLTICESDAEEWPCPTIRALDGK